MHARVTTLEVPPDRMDDATRHVQEQVLPRLSQMEGFKGIIALGSRQSGKLQGVAFWESEEALRATDEAVVPVREGAAEAAGGTVASVEEYEVFVNEAPSAGPLGAVTDTVGGVTDTVGGVTDTVGGTPGNLLGGGEKKR
jgi:heme-degrading monooxygenase HmoA